VFDPGKQDQLNLMLARDVRAHCYKNIRPYFTNNHNKLVCLSLAGPYKLICCLWVRPGAYPRVDQLKGTLPERLEGALLTSIAIDWKGEIL
jgi:hypothetical protein